MTRDEYITLRKSDDLLRTIYDSCVYKGISEENASRLITTLAPDNFMIRTFYQCVINTLDSEFEVIILRDKDNNILDIY